MEEKWYTRLLAQVKNSYSGVIIVSDPDGMADDPEFKEQLEKDFHIHQYRSELKLRSFLSKHKNLETLPMGGESSAKRLLIFRPSEKEYFPSDIENQAEPFSWSLNNIFPQLDKKTVRDFSSGIYQTLYGSCKNALYKPQSADPKSTLHLICLWVWNTKLTEIKSREELISFLYKAYLDIDSIPETLKTYLFEVQYSFPETEQLPHMVWEGSEQFYGWIKSKWQDYRKASALSPEYEIDFSENSLTEIKEKLQSEDDHDKLPERSGLLKEIWQILHLDPIDWRNLAIKWGELCYLKDEGIIEEEKHSELDLEITPRFESFILSQYGDLFIQNSRDNLVTIDRVMQHIGQKDGEKKLLFCFDGMAFQEWYCIKAYLEENGIFNFDEKAIYALLPTVTSISRRALFCGEKEVSKLKPEPQGFSEFVKARWGSSEGKYIKCFTNVGSKWDPKYLDFEYLGIITNIVDNIAHNLQHMTDVENKRQMQEILKQMLRNSELAKTFRTFLDEGYRIFITADHGTIWCEGNGYVVEKYLAEQESKRALKYPDRTLAHDYYKGKNTDLYLFPHYETLGKEVIIFPKGRKMFAKKGVKGITHGGVHIEEAIIPFIEVSK